MPPTLPTTAPATTGGEVPSLLGAFAVPFLPCAVGTLDVPVAADPTPTPGGMKGSELELGSALGSSDEDDELNRRLDDCRSEENELDIYVDNVEDELKPPRAEGLIIPEREAIDEASAGSRLVVIDGKLGGGHIHLLELKSDELGEDVIAADPGADAAELGADDYD